MKSNHPRAGFDNSAPQEYPKGPKEEHEDHPDEADVGGKDKPEYQNEQPYTNVENAVVHGNCTLPAFGPSESRPRTRSLHRASTRARNSEQASLYV